MIRVILCDDHALIRRGIRDTLSDLPDIEVVGEAGDYAELRSLMRDKGGCDVLVLDINLPDIDGTEVTAPKMTQVLLSCQSRTRLMVSAPITSAI